MRVIVVGSGLSGLVMGHCLRRAGIDDFVILERRPDPVERSGSVIGFFPQTFRILDQLGLLKETQKLSQPLHHWLHLDPAGGKIYDGEFFDCIEANHGHPSMLFMRHDLMEVLYSNLPDRERHVLAGKKVTAITQDDASVTVTCADNSVFQGDILIGCDGVHSIVRRLGFPQPEAPPRAKYRALFGSSPLPEGLAPCNITETHDKDIVFMILCSHDKAFWLITNRKAEDAPATQKYTSDDIQAFVDKYQDHSVAPGAKVKFSDLWRTRNMTPGPGMYDYHEGIAERWYNGRIVIVGDAAHRMTPNLGQGGNNSIESVASLANQINALVKESANPSTQQWEAAFARFQQQRHKQVKFIAGLTGSYTRWASWRNWLGWFMQAWAWPSLGDRFIVNWMLSPNIAQSIKLDFVEEPNLPAGKVKWKYA